MQKKAIDNLNRYEKNDRSKSGFPDEVSTQNYIIKNRCINCKCDLAFGEVLCDLEWEII